jgi:RNA polymerase sigma-70 factor (ECF subfamily)
VAIHALAPPSHGGATWVREPRPGPDRATRRLDALVACAQAGDRQAFREVTEALGPPLLRFVTGYLRGDADTASDVVQDTFVAAWRKIDTIRPGGHIRPWLYRVARCKAITWLRRRGPQGTPMDSIEHYEDAGFLLPDEDETGCDELAPMPSLDALRAAIALLPPLYAGAIRLHYLHGFDTRETAHLLGVPRTAVKMRLHRARKKLRELMAEFTEE